MSLRIGLAALLALSLSASAADKKKQPPAPAPALPELPLLAPSPAPAAAPPAPRSGGFQLGIYRLVPAGTVDDPALTSIEDTFLDVAQASKRYRSVVKLAKPPKLCELEDDNCFALLGGFQQLDQVLVGEVLHLSNGVTVRVRLVDVQKGKAVGDKALTVQAEDKNEIKAWAEALACDLINNETCKGQAMVDVDLPDMRVIVDNQQYPRTGKNPELFTTPLGVHSLRVAVDQRTSVERKLLVGRTPPAKPSLFARQLEGGGISLLRSQDLQLGAGGKPELAASVPTAQLKTGKWTKPVGLTVAGVGVVLAAVGVFQGLHSKSLVDQAQKNYATNGAYLASDLTTLDSAHSAATLGNVLTIGGAVLLISGAVLTFAF